jgi:transposase
MAEWGGLAARIFRGMTQVSDDATAAVGPESKQSQRNCDMSKRTDLDVPQRIEAVLALIRREEPAAKIVRRYGIAETTLYRYRDQFVEGGKAALSNGHRGKSDPREQDIERLHKDVSRRDRVIGELTIANRILKKTSDDLS